MRIRRTPAALALALVVSLTTAADTAEPAAIDTGNGTLVAHLDFDGASEVDWDGERYAYVGQINGKYNRGNVAEGQEGGLRVVDLVGDPAAGVEQFEQVGYLNCPGTDNYVRYMDPEVFSPNLGRKFVAMAHHGNLCTAEALLDEGERLSGSYGGQNGVAVVDVTDPTAPEIVDVVAHWSSHTVMPHPTEPYLYVLPGGLTNGSRGTSRISPTGIVKVAEDGTLEYVKEFEHNITGCHDLGFTADGEYAYCAGAGEIQTWDTSDAANPQVVRSGSIVNPAIMFPHNAVVSPDGTKLLINDEAFGFHTCEGNAADLYGSLWIYDISDPEVPVLAGRISPPKRSGKVGTYPGWVQSWCAAHNYNFVPGTDIVVASWFAGGWTAHDISNPLLPELVAAHQPAPGEDGDPSVLWSAHYYGGYIVTGDMGKGTEIYDVPSLREAEAAAKAEPEASTTALAAATRLQTPRIDRTAELIPAELPARPARPAFTTEGGFCVIPGVAR